MAINELDRPRVLVVEADASVRRLVAIELELDGAEVVAADSLARALEVLRSTTVSAIVMGDVGASAREAQEVAAEAGDGVTVVSLIDSSELVMLLDDRKLSLAARLSLPAPPHETLAASALMAAEVEAVAQAWSELCRWDPMLPPEAQPPVPGAVVAAFASALDRPQPIGWGPDPQVEAAVQSFAERVGAVDVVVAELVCLREALRRWLLSRVPVSELAETMARLDMIADRAIQVAVAHAVDSLQRDAFTDALTGLLNRRALERDMRRELARATRYDRRVTVMVFDLDGLKQVNDRHGHAAGDEHLCRLARTFERGLRLGDVAYRVGGDEFVVLLPEVGESRAGPVAQRLVDLDAPSFSWGAATFPLDGTDLEELLQTADARLYESRRATR